MVKLVLLYIVSLKVAESIDDVRLGLTVVTAVGLLVGSFLKI